MVPVGRCQRRRTRGHHQDLSLSGQAMVHLVPGSWGGAGQRAGGRFKKIPRVPGRPRSEAFDHFAQADDDSKILPGGGRPATPRGKSGRRDQGPPGPLGLRKDQAPLSRRGRTAVPGHPRQRSQVPARPRHADADDSRGAAPGRNREDERLRPGAHDRSSRGQDSGARQGQGQLYLSTGGHHRHDRRLSGRPRENAGGRRGRGAALRLDRQGEHAQAPTLEDRSERDCG